MQDRISLYPGRVTLTPVAGQANTYDMVRADSPTQTGDPLSKATFLADATAALFGAGAVAVPDDALAVLGRYAEYWWAKYSTTEGYVAVYGNTSYFRYVVGHPNNKTIQYADAISVDQSTGAVSLSGTIKMATWSSGDTSGFVEEIQGKYIITSMVVPSGGKLCYVPVGAKYKRYDGESFDESSVLELQVQIITSMRVTGDTLIGYVQSPDAAAYPNDGTKDGYLYKGLGIPLDNAVSPARLAVGSYVGTGTYGSTNKCSLTFNFPPKALILFNGDANAGMKSPMLLISPDRKQNFVQGEAGGYNIRVTWSGNNVSWYSTNNEKVQFNTTYGTNYYIALG